MSMPSGDSPQKAQQFYDYLLAHHQTEHRVKTWTVDWFSLAGTAPNVEVILELDGDRFWELLKAATG